MTAFHMPELMDAVRLPDHNQVASRIKDLVINQLVATDERVKIHKTEYFNHSFVPDLVLSWQDQEGRHLFLRPETRPELLVDDLRISGDLHPIYFSLTDIDTDSAREHRAELEIMSAQSDTLVTDSDGLDRLISSRRENPIAQLASSAALQGARGVLDAPRAVLVARAVTDGLNAASNVDQTGAAAASQTISSMFDSRRSSQLNRLLLAVWTGSGGSASQFPVPINSISGLDEESIDYLLRLNLIDDEEFWRRIGRQLRLGHLSSLRIEDDSPNFQMLVNANIDVLAARTCRVEPVVPTLMDPDPESADHPLQWKIERGNLTLRGSRFVAYVAEKREHLPPLALEPTRTSFSELMDRLTAHNISVVEITLNTRIESVSYSSDAPFDPAREPKLQAVERALGSNVSVQSVVVPVHSHSPLTCDFRNATTNGKTNALYPLGELIRLSLALLTAMSGEEASRVNSLAAEQPMTVDDPQATLDFE